MDDSVDDAARELGLIEDECEEYRFNLETRRLLPFRASSASRSAAENFIEASVGTPDRLMAFAEDRHLPKTVLAPLLSDASRLPYLKTCADIERQYTHACTARHDPCLESGCSFDGEDETCLQPLSNAGVEYERACAAAWIKLFRAPQNRVEAWRH